MRDSKVEEECKPAAGTGARRVFGQVGWEAAPGRDALKGQSVYEKERERLPHPSRCIQSFPEGLVSSVCNWLLHMYNSVPPHVPTIVESLILKFAFSLLI